jgi:tetratricopeptide (TPR) repeat protein
LKILLRVNNFGEKRFLKDMDKGKKVKWWEEGDRFLGLGEYERAIECYNKAIELNSGDAVAWFGKGKACYKLGRYKEAIDCFRRVRELVGNDILGLEAFEYLSKTLREYIDYLRSVRGK